MEEVTFTRQTIELPKGEEKVYMKWTDKQRLPRKRKKWLKKFGGWEYYIQVPSKKKIEKATEQDFIDLMNKLEEESDVTWPVYDGSGNVTVTSKDSNGLKRVVMMRTERLHDAMKEAAERIYGK